MKPKKISDFFAELITITIIATVLLWLDHRIFFLFAFIYFFYALDRRIEYLRKILRVLWVYSSAESAAIFKHLKIPFEEVEKIKEKAINTFPADVRESFEKDFDDIMR